MQIISVEKVYVLVGGILECGTIYIHNPCLFMGVMWNYLFPSHIETKYLQISLLYFPSLVKKKMNQ